MGKAAWPPDEGRWGQAQGGSHAPSASSAKRPADQGSMSPGVGGLSWAGAEVRGSDRASLRAELVTWILCSTFELRGGEITGSWALRDPWPLPHHPRAEHEELISVKSP